MLVHLAFRATVEPISWPNKHFYLKLQDSFKYIVLHRGPVKVTYAVNEPLCYLKYNEIQINQSNDGSAAALIHKMLCAADAIYTPFKECIIMSGNRNEKSHIKSNASMCGNKQYWKSQQFIHIIKFLHAFCTVYLPQRQKCPFMLKIPWE